MVKIPETHTPSSISLGRNTPDSLDAVGSKISNPFADAIDTLGVGLNMFGKTLEAEQKAAEAKKKEKAVEAEKQRVAKLKAAEDAHKQELSSQVAEYTMVLSNRISDYQAKTNGKEVSPDTVIPLGRQVFDAAFDEKKANSFGFSGPLSPELNEKLKEVTFNLIRPAYNEIQKRNLTLRAEQTVERKNLSDKAIVQGISNGEIGLDEINGLFKARRIAGGVANEPEDITAKKSNALLRDGLKGLVLNKTNDLPLMKALLGDYVTFPNAENPEETLTYRKIVGDKDFLATKKAYQSNLENKLAKAAIESEGLDVRKSLFVDGMYENEAELDAANKRVRDKETALRVQKQQIRDRENRIGFTSALNGDSVGAPYVDRVAIDMANAEEANNLQTANIKRLMEERNDLNWFSYKRKSQIDDALFNIDKQKGNAELFSMTVVFSGEPLDYLRIVNSDEFKNAGGSQKFLLEDMKLKAKYDRAKDNLSADIDVEALIDKAVKSLDPKGLYGKDYLQPDIRRELATTLSGVAPNKSVVENLINQTAAKVYGRTVFTNEKQKTDYDSLVDIVQAATANRKTNQTKDDVFMSVRNKLNDKYDSDIVDRMMPYIISGQYVKAIGVADAFKSR